MTIIAFIGSVFSPWYAARRSRGGADPADHVSVNAVLYGPRGKRWAMTERGAGALDRSATHLAIGPSRVAWTGGSLTIDIDEWAVPIPARLKGRIVVRPDYVFDRVYALDAGGRHRWRPVAPRAQVEVAFDRPSVRWRGAGYLDMNAGDEPLEDAFRAWTWSRSERADGTTIFYDVDPRVGPARGLALTCHPHGEVEPAEAPPFHPLPATLWRVRRQARSEAAPAQPATLEDTPFYTRSKFGVRLAGEDCPTIGESVDFDRFAARWVQALLPFRMPRRRL